MVAKIKTFTEEQINKMSKKELQDELLNIEAFCKAEIKRLEAKK